jgi:hypothetical protein
MLSAVGLSDIDCPLWQSNRPIAAHFLDSISRDAFWSDHQSTLVAIGIGRHVRVGSKPEVAALPRNVYFASVSGHRKAIPTCPKSANFGSRRLYQRTEQYPGCYMSRVEVSDFL